jgi:hypothetical protein
MKRFSSNLLSWTIILTLSTPAQAGVELDCSEGSSQGLDSCKVIEDRESKPECSSMKPLHSMPWAEEMVEEFSKVKSCNDEDLKLSSGRNRNEINILKEDLKKECKKKAKEYKKAVLQDLMSHHRFGQALKVLFKRKKFKVKKNESDEVENALTLDGKNLSGKTSSELNQLVMDELEKLQPGIKAKADALMKVHPSFQYGFHENEAVPLNLVIKSNDSKLCTVKLQNLPKPKPFVPDECQFCDIKDVKNSFVNDCSYMVSKNFPEAKVDSLLGIQDQNRKNYCQPEMNGQETDMSNIDAAATELCKIAQKGMVPDFNIQTSRNLYPDKTPELAKKRGQFIQKYIQDKLKNECDLAALPDWISNEEDFQQKVQLSHPYYEGGKPGDYGPDPHAPIASQELEIKNFRTTLLKEKESLEKDLKDLEQQIRSMESELSKANSEMDRVSKKYSALQKNVTKTQDLNAAETLFDSQNPGSATSLANQMDDWLNLSHEHQQKLSDLNALKKSNLNRLSEYTDTKMNNRVNLLQQFYSEKNSGKQDKDFGRNWDEKLFNDFKMVRISGKALQSETHLGSSQAIEPKLDVMLNLVTQADEFACVVDPMQTKNVKFKTYLKGGAQIVTGTVAVAGVIGAGALTLGAGVINSFLSLVCIGCGDPGSTLPTWRKVGNIFAIGDKSSRKAFWKDFKHVFKDVVTINGNLSVKSKSNFKVNQYNDFEKYAEQYYGENYQSKSRIEGSLTVKENRDKKGILLSIETYDENNVLREVIEFSPNSGKEINRTRYNKDGVEL